MMIEENTKDLKILLDYLWHDESAHYQEHRAKDHIFLVMKRLAKTINHRAQ